MAINKAMRLALKALSYSDIDVRKSRMLAGIKALDPLKIFYHTLDTKVYNRDHEVPLRVYLPETDCEIEDPFPVLLFIHGGGWVTESVETYNKVCADLARHTSHMVISIDYSLAPEYPFPIGLEDCYEAAKAVYGNHLLLKVNPKRITLIGDSAGGNLAAALSLMARDRGEFLPQRQILIYPCTNNDHSETSPYPSVRENGTDYLLTAKKLQQYLALYRSSDEDLSNPYFAPLIAKDLSRQPRTLIITAQYDPLRDEGEAYGEKLRQFGNEVEIRRIRNALHGYFALGIQSRHVRQSSQLINHFLKGV